MEPNSLGLILLLLAAVGALFWAMKRYGHLAVRIVAAGLVVVLSAVTGMAVVNDYYGYYRTWGQLSADLSGSYSAFGTGIARTTSSTTTVGGGVVRSVTFPGPRSGISRPGYVYLPPQYFQKRYAHTTFPVAELIHGSPGTPQNWLVELNVAKVMDELIARHQIGPMILVMPTMNGTSYQDCVNGPTGADDTYIAQDVRTDVLAHFRASTVPSEWGIAGFSSGGYCAADLALRHRAMFGAAGIMDGYFRPQDGPAAQALGNDPAAEAANNPLTIAAHLPQNVSPLPAFWLSAGTGSAVDIVGAEAFAKALHGVEQVTLYKEIGAGHNFYDWSGSLPTMLTWLWAQLASPQLRVAFPIAGSVHGGALVAPPLPAILNLLRHHHHKSSGSRYRVVAGGGGVKKGTAHKSSSA